MKHMRMSIQGLKFTMKHTELMIGHMGENPFAVCFTVRNYIVQ